MENEKVKNAIRNNFEVIIVPGSNAKRKIYKLRDLKSDSIGKLVKVRGIVTKVSEVSPILDIAMYICQKCNAEIFQTVKNRKFNPVV